MHVGIFSRLNRTESSLLAAVLTNLYWRSGHEVTWLAPNFRRKARGYVISDFIDNEVGSVPEDFANTPRFNDWLQDTDVRLWFDHFPNATDVVTRRAPHQNFYIPPRYTLRKDDGYRRDLRRMDYTAVLAHPHTAAQVRDMVADAAPVREMPLPLMPQVVTERRDTVLIYLDRFACDGTVPSSFSWASDLKRQIEKRQPGVRVRLLTDPPGSTRFDDDENSCSSFSLLGEIRAASAFVPILRRDSDLLIAHAEHYGTLVATFADWQVSPFTRDFAVTPQHVCSRSFLTLPTYPLVASLADAVLPGRCEAFRKEWAGQKKARIVAACDADKAWCDLLS